MKTAFLVTLLAISAGGQAAAAAPVPEPLSIREQIKADRAKAKADEENGPKARFWDRGANGKRPWDPSKETPLTKE
jgi:nitrous oxide reductase accessory protein NosL